MARRGVLRATLMALALTAASAWSPMRSASVARVARRNSSPLVVQSTTAEPEVATTAPTGESSVAMPQKTNAWEVHKFGGASLETPELYRTVGDLLISEAAGRGSGAIPTMAIVSAMGGMTDKLVKVVDSALEDFISSINSIKIPTMKSAEKVRQE